MAQVVNMHFTKEEIHMANRMPYLSHKGKVKLNHTDRGFPGSPVVRTPCFHCREHVSHPWSEN